MKHIAFYIQISFKLIFIISQSCSALVFRFFFCRCFSSVSVRINLIPLFCYWWDAFIIWHSLKYQSFDKIYKINLTGVERIHHPCRERSHTHTPESDWHNLMVNLFTFSGSSQFIAHSTFWHAALIAVNHYRLLPHCINIPPVFRVEKSKQRNCFITHPRLLSESLLCTTRQINPFYVTNLNQSASCQKCALQIV